MAAVSDGLIAAGATGNARPAGVDQRVVVLGASNVRRGLARLATVLRSRTAGGTLPAAPIDLYVAAGHGRSYGATSRVWLRRLPSILRCGLWNALDRAAVGDGHGLALVTDIGNDLLYGFPPAQVADWVHECMGRLADRGLHLAVTRLPLASVASVGPARYRALRALYVPGCPLTLSALQAAARDLDERLERIAISFRAALLDQPGHWYGIDAIHVRRRRLDDLWNRTADAWGLGDSPPKRASIGEWARLGTHAAEVRSLAGTVRYTRQPMVAAHPLRIWMY